MFMPTFICWREWFFIEEWHFLQQWLKFLNEILNVFFGLFALWKQGRIAMENDGCFRSVLGKTMYDQPEEIVDIGSGTDDVHVRWLFATVPNTTNINPWQFGWQMICFELLKEIIS
jgi:hypothetical protein